MFRSRGRLPFSGIRASPWSVYPALVAVSLVVAYYVHHSRRLRRDVATHSAALIRRLAGKPISLSLQTYDGVVVVLPHPRPVVVLVGQSTCSPCRAMHRALRTDLLRDPVAARSVEVWLVTTNASWPREENLADLTVVRSLRPTLPNQLIESLGTARIPALLVLDSLGTIRLAQVGYAGSLEDGWIGRALK
jgi:hypothetical protein